MRVAHGVCGVRSVRKVCCVREVRGGSALRDMAQKDMPLRDMPLGDTAQRDMPQKDMPPRDMALACVVREEGLEPSRSYRTQEPESCASANSATRAFGYLSLSLT